MRGVGDSSYTYMWAHLRSVVRDFGDTSEIVDHMYPQGVWGLALFDEVTDRPSHGHARDMAMSCDGRDMAGRRERHCWWAHGGTTAWSRPGNEVVIARTGSWK